MSIYQSALWRADLDTALQVLPELAQLDGCTVLITGAAGLICSAAVDLLLRCNDLRGTNIRVCAAGRSEEKMRLRFGDRCDRADFRFVPYDSSRSDNVFDFPCDYIIHGAANSSPGKITKEPVETMLGNFLGMKQLLDLAREKGSRRVLYISSSEVYGKKQTAAPYREDEYGYIDLLLPRNSYSVGKQAAETLCVSYADEYGVDPVIVRPGHIYGPTANREDNHVSSAWAYDAALGRDILMKSDGAQKRSYVYCLDCATAILKVLLCGERCHAYNISNPDSVISIRRMAELLAAAGGVSLRREAASADEQKGFNPMSNSSLESGSLQALGWHGCFDAETGLEHTVRILRETAG